MLKEILNNTEKYTKEHCKSTRKDKGQFFTPQLIVDFMASQASTKALHLSILEPGAGNGLLTAALIKHCVDLGLCKSFSVRFIENDSDVLPVLEKTVVLISHYVDSQHGNVNISISTENYITGKENGKYDVVICNPPYKKIRKDSAESECMRDYVFGQPNLYTLFMCKAVNNLKPDGKFVFITPRSWTSGNYYKTARKFLLENLSLTDLLLFKDRTKVFAGEDVLQETLITIGIKTKSQVPYINIFSSLEAASSCESMKVEADVIKSIGEDTYLLLPSSKKDLQILKQMTTITDTFESLGYCFKTGPVVEFRNRKALSCDRKEGFAPMYRTANIVNGKCIFPANTDKAQYISAKEKKLLLLDMNTVFIRRMSAKEEHRRLQSCVYYQTNENEYISIENHVNYLVHADGSALTKKEAEWINKLLMSEEYDTYYRILNGSTQVNASEINKLPLKKEFYETKSNTF